VVNWFKIQRKEQVLFRLEAAVKKATQLYGSRDVNFQIIWKINLSTAY